MQSERGAYYLAKGRPINSVSIVVPELRCVPTQARCGKRHVHGNVREAAIEFVKRRGFGQCWCKAPKGIYVDHKPPTEEVFPLEAAADIRPQGKLRTRTRIGSNPVGGEPPKRVHQEKGKNSPGLIQTRAVD